jgi:hypothetical protein
LPFDICLLSFAFCPCTIQRVRRSLAVVVLFVTGLWPVAPLLSSASPTPQLPLCCRANGKHKCSASKLQQGAPESSTQPAIRSICDQWPVLFHISSTAVSPSVFLPPATQLFYAAIASHPVAQAQTESRFRISFDRSRQKRGPPLSL